MKFTRTRTSKKTIDVDPLLLVQHCIERWIDNGVYINDRRDELPKLQMVSLIACIRRNELSPKGSLFGEYQREFLRTVADMGA